MFERYTEDARRTMFFARQAATACGCVRIESEHLLLGLIREGGPAVRDLVPSQTAEEIRRRIPEKKPEAADLPLVMPLSDECKWILAYAADEADNLHHPQIAAEHLLLAILREDSCSAARLLAESGAELNHLRQRVATDSTRPDSREVSS